MKSFAILATWYFRSSSDPSKEYQTIQHAIPTAKTLRETLSCNCPGWTRRVQGDGTRMCVHTRLVIGGSPEKDPLFMAVIKEDEYLFIPAYPSQNYKKRTPEPITTTRSKRKFNFDDE